MKTTKLIAVFLFAAVALSGAYAQGKAKGAPNKAQGAKSPPALSSFCGFKAGEEMQAAKKRSKLKYGVIENYNFWGADRPNGWPRDNNRWLHSDITKVAYFYVFDFFDNLTK